MTGTYDTWLVILSIVVAVIASYVALDLVSRITASTGSKAARYWLAGGALSMGTGVWSMHFIGMLAFRLPIPMSYDIPITLLSLLIAVSVSGFALFTVSHGTLSMTRLMRAGLFMGLGIASMHYSGMAAMQMLPPIRYDTFLFILSILIAIAASLAALWIAFQLRSETMLSAFWKRGGSALVMGAAISGMHYTAMAAAIFAPNSICTVSPQDINNVWLAASIGGFTFMFLTTTLLISVFDARLADRSSKLAETLRQANVVLETRSGELSRANTRLQQEMQERLQVENALRESEERYRQLVELSPDAILIQNEGRFAFVNSACMKLLGAATSDELIGKPVIDIVHPDYRGIVIERSRQIMEENRTVPPLEEKMLRLDGTAVDVEVTASPFTYKGKSGAQVVMRDITQRKAHEAQILHLATHDALTNLPNRNLLNDRIYQAIAHAQRSGHTFGLLILDLDRFKFINDAYGHDSGDALLLALTSRLRSAVREGDTVARLGGDEFVVLLSPVDGPEDLIPGVRRLLDVFSSPFVVKDTNLNVTTSIGVTVYPTDGTQPEALLKNADTAMYRAKELGRNGFQFFTPEMSARATERYELENALRRAVERKELKVYYQPQMDVKTGQLVAVEALVRWQHPTLGLVPPSHFMSIAEETGLIIPIGEWVLKTACAQNKAWQDAGSLRLRIGVNISAKQFWEGQILQTVARALTETGLAPNDLELEVTEAVFLRDVEETIRTISKLRSMGVAVSMDDFGTGYSSLNLLRRFPIEKLKIDRSFITDLTGVPEGMVLLQQIIRMAHAINLTVVAEGVETQNEFAFLAESQCDAAQGYYFHKPLSSTEFEQLIKQK